MIKLPNEVSDLIARGALFVVNHSGGKDSQAMLIELAAVVPAAQMVVIHASLGDMEWPGALELAETQAKADGVEFIVARAAKTFLEMVERRFADRPSVPSWPSASTRQCTSDLKRDPIAREARRYAKANGFSLIVNCMGIRAAESVSRSKLQAFKVNARLAGAGREAYDWLPIFDRSTAGVFETIAAAGQTPHPAYAAGNDRLSCVFCVMASRKDIANGARHFPELLQRYVDLEHKTGYYMHMSRKPLLQFVAEAQAAAEIGG